MSDASKSMQGAAGGLEGLGFAAIRFIKFFSSIAWEGIRSLKSKYVDAIFVVLILLLFIFLVTFKDYAYLKALNWLMPRLVDEHAVSFLRKIPRWGHFTALAVTVFYSALFFMGLAPFVKRRQYQNSLDAVGLRNAVGKSPTVTNVICLDDQRTKLIVTAKGVGLDRLEAKKADLESSFGQIVEKIDASADRKAVIILLCKKELKRHLTFDEARTQLNSPYSFVVGESANGIIVQDIRDLPHMLIAGSTGGGKSVFFRQVLIGLLESSPHLQMYLIDLKRGVEVKEFGLLPNVRIAKDELEAVQVLTALKEEMHRRFAFMEQVGIKKIEPEIHKRDLIVVGIDEASVLYGKTSLSKAKKELVASARDLTDEIAKLARAAGIHLIIATQKAVKESLDTKTLENLPGKMVFKMSTHAGSNTALGNSRAYSLPDIKGRGIWAGGNKFIEVQAPFLSEKELEDECKDLAENLNREEKRNFQPMLGFAVAESAKTSGFNENEQRDTDQ